RSVRPWPRRSRRPSRSSPGSSSPRWAGGPSRERRAVGERTNELARTELFTNFHRVLRLLRAFEVSNSVFDGPIEELARATRTIVELEGEIELRMEENTVFVNRWPIRLDRGGRERAIELQVELATYGIGAIVLKAALTNETVRAFLRVLAA